MHSELTISQSDGRPMYLQIMEQIKQRIAVGDWPRGEEIPSIRQLAVSLRVSVITVKRAYLELEREGVIVTQQGKGSTVAPNPELGHWRGAIPKGRIFATTRDELIECAAGVRAIHLGDLDRIIIPDAPLDILAQ